PRDRCPRSSAAPLGIRRWLTGLRGRGPRIVGTSKGGSRLLKYGGGEFETPQIGFTEESTRELSEAREKVYDELFGESDFVYHELLPLVPHVDVYRISPTDDRPFYTFVTGGMSDLPMNSPKELGAACRRVELVFYA